MSILQRIEAQSSRQIPHFCEFCGKRMCKSLALSRKQANNILFHLAFLPFHELDDDLSKDYRKRIPFEAKHGKNTAAQVINILFSSSFRAFCARTIDKHCRKLLLLLAEGRRKVKAREKLWVYLSSRTMVEDDAAGAFFQRSRP